MLFSDKYVEKTSAAIKNFPVRILISTNKVYLLLNIEVKKQPMAGMGHSWWTHILLDPIKIV